MAVTTLDPMTALIVVDLQNGILGFPVAHPVEQIVRHASTLADGFRAHGQPVVLVTVVGAPTGRTERPRGGARQQPPAGWADLAPDLNQQPDDHTVTKRTWGAFHDTGLDQHLQSLGVTQVVIAGALRVATSIGLESTARQAHEHGFNVTLAVDAMTDATPEAHTNTVTRIFPRLGETGTPQGIIDLLDRTPT